MHDRFTVQYSVYGKYALFVYEYELTLHQVQIPLCWSVFKQVYWWLIDCYFEESWQYENKNANWVGTEYELRRIVVAWRSEAYGGGERHGGWTQFEGNEGEVFATDRVSTSIVATAGEPQPEAQSSLDARERQARGGKENTRVAEYDVRVWTEEPVYSIDAKWKRHTTAL